MYIFTLGFLRGSLRVLKDQMPRNPLWTCFLSLNFHVHRSIWTLTHSWLSLLHRGFFHIPLPPSVPSFPIHHEALFAGSSGQNVHSCLLVAPGHFMMACHTRPVHGTWFYRGKHTEANQSTCFALTTFLQNSSWEVSQEQILLHHIYVWMYRLYICNRII